MALAQHVLIVDDDDSIRALLRMACEDAAYVVSEAHNGAVALQRLGAEDERLVVLLDCQMPVMDGKRVLEAVEADEALATRHAYVVMSAHPIPHTVVDLLAQRNIVVLGKPFNMERLLLVVAQAAQRLADDASA